MTVMLSGLDSHARRASYTMENSQKTFSLRLRSDQVITLPRPCVMGVINMSPNSFYRPIATVSDALFEVEKMLDAGASFIDIGGEATNPFVDLEEAAPTVQQEIDRVVPLVEAIKRRFDVLISVDTSQPAVMREAVHCAADLINDQRALGVKGALETIEVLKVPVCLMHFFNPIREAGSSDCQTLLETIKQDLQESIARCKAQGILSDRLIIDLGFGQGNYGKNCEENFYLLSHLKKFVDLDLPVLVGWSRKSMIGEALGGVPAEQRLYGSVAAATIAAMLGASIIRVHDVKETVDAMKVVGRLNSF